MPRNDPTAGHAHGSTFPPFLVTWCPHDMNCGWWRNLERESSGDKSTSISMGSSRPAVELASFRLSIAARPTFYPLCPTV